MTNPQDPFATPAEGSTPPSRPAQAPAWGPTTGSAWESQPAAPGWGTPTGAERRNGLGTAALVLGVLALLTGLFLIGGLLGLVAIVLGALGLGRVKRGEADNRGMAVAGIVLGALGVLLAGLVAFGFAAFFGSTAGQELTDCLGRAGSDQAAVEQCQREFDESLRTG